MFEIDNIVSYTSQNIQVLGVFIAVIGGIVTSRLISLVVEKDSLIEKRKRLKDEIDFISSDKSNKEKKLHKFRKEEFIESVYRSIYNDICDGTFPDKSYSYIGLSKCDRDSIVNEIVEILSRGYGFFQGDYEKSDIERILKEQNIEFGSIEYDIMSYVGKKKMNRPTPMFNLYPFDVIEDLPRIKSLSENLNEISLEKLIDEMDSTIEWKMIELANTEIRIHSINQNLNIKNEVSIFISITTLGILIPQTVVSFYPLIEDCVWFNYGFAIYSVLVFLGCMIKILLYIYDVSKHFLGTD